MTAAAQSAPRTRVVNLRRSKYDVYIGRVKHRRHGGSDGIFGNPFVLLDESERAEVVEKFRAYFLDRVERDLDFRAKVLALRGRVLGCFCKPKACHGDVIAEWVDAQPEVSP